MNCFKNIIIGIVFKAKHNRKSCNKQTSQNLGTMLRVSILRTNDQQQTFRSMVDSIVDQFLVDYDPTTVPDLFQTTGKVFDLLTTHQILKSAPN